MSRISTAEAYAPATMGNVGIGFDILGLAFEQPGDRVVATRRNEPGVVIEAITGDGGVLPLASDENTAAIAASALLNSVKADHGACLTLHKGLPLASGLGSSAASAVAAVVAVNALLNAPLPHDTLLPYCLEGEAAVSGYHADNVAPCLMGGVTLVDLDASPSVRRLPVPADLWFALVTPEIEVPTATARALLPSVVSLKVMTQQTAGVARAIDALYRLDVHALAAAMEADRVIEPARGPLIPHLAAARVAAKSQGALALVISGAGPTLCAVCQDERTAQQVSIAVKRVFDDDQIGSTARVTTVSHNGASVINVLS